MGISMRYTRGNPAMGDTNSDNEIESTEEYRGDLPDKFYLSDADHEKFAIVRDSLELQLRVGRTLECCSSRMCFYSIRLFCYFTSRRKQSRRVEEGKRELWYN